MTYVRLRSAPPPSRRFHRADSLEPSEAGGRISEKGAAGGTEAATERLGFKFVERFCAIGNCSDMRFDQRAIFRLNGKIQEFACRPVGDSLE